MSEFNSLTGWYIQIPKRRWWHPPKFQSTKTLTWEVGRIGSGLLVTVGAGQEFDGSVPMFLRPWIKPDDPRALKAFCLHDALLERSWDRVSAAAAFSDALRAGGVSKAKRLAMVLAVISWNWR